MIQIGLTGGIGSGKTTVAKLFEHLGVPIYFSDDRAKLILDSDENLKDSICNSFEISKLPNGLIDKKELADIVFLDKTKLEELNKLIHPRVAIDYTNWVEDLKDSSPYSIKEAAILYESGSAKHMDSVIVVSCPLALRISRVMARDNVSKEDVLSRMANQWAEEKKVELANHIVYNDEEHSLLKQVLDLHRIFIE
ncbi:MAG: dephospho-CoA kinase [Patiriisocius sp.]|jgi:dephospho-CoA kinase